MAWLSWQKGRQDSGYSKMLLGTSRFPIPWDCYILKYPTGSEVPIHQDPVDGRKHFRLNIVLREASSGGTFYCQRTIVNTRYIKLFRPDLYRHSVSRVVSGSRYVLSIGWVLS